MDATCPYKEADSQVNVELRLYVYGVLFRPTLSAKYSELIFFDDTLIEKLKINHFFWHVTK